MRSKFITRLAVLTVGLVASTATAQFNPPPAPRPLDQNLQLLPQPRGVEVLGKGPIHEAFARPADDRPGPGPIVEREPPAAVEELPPDQRPEGSIWLPGYWQWDDERSEYLWVSGFWRIPPPGRQWVPGQVQRAAGGYRWVPGFWASVQTTDLTYLPPPPASLETGPAMPAPQEEATYIPGSWIYQDTGYRWRGGYWTQYRPGWVWTPAHYCWTPAGYIFVDGFWDQPLERRGCLFAPVAFDVTVLRPGFVWTPSYVVTHDFLPSALFVRSGHGCYYFGDYYAPRYSGQGYNFWFDFRFGRTCHDPLFGYYRVANRNLAWERDIRGIYLGRVRGDLPPPPPTLGAMLAPLPPLGGPATLGRPPGFLAPPPLALLGPAAMAPGLSLARVGGPERDALTRGAADLRSLGVQRGTLERNLVDRGPPLRPNDMPRTLGLNLPGTPPRGAAINLPAPGGNLPGGNRPTTPGLSIINTPPPGGPNLGNVTLPQPRSNPLPTPNLMPQTIGNPVISNPTIGRPNLGSAPAGISMPNNPPATITNPPRGNGITQPTIANPPRGISQPALNPPSGMPAGISMPNNPPATISNPRRGNGIAQPTITNPPRGNGIIQPTIAPPGGMPSLPSLPGGNFRPPGGLPSLPGGGLPPLPSGGPGLPRMSINLPALPALPSGGLMPGAGINTRISLSPPSMPARR